MNRKDYLFFSLCFFADVRYKFRTEKMKTNEIILLYWVKDEKVPCEHF